VNTLTILFVAAAPVAALVGLGLVYAYRQDGVRRDRRHV
jgi:hypothetical protein